MANKLELTWYGKENQVNVEPRILIEDKSLSNVVNGDTENMLIHGDNLLALKALEKDYAGKIKCIYIDPPYNTGSAFEHYDDNLEHSIWLNLMKSRLELLKKLLSDDGLIYIQIDDNEQAYLKVLCDEIFGRNNFVNCIAVKMSPSSGLKRSHKDKGFIKNKEYILIYSKGNVAIEPLYDVWQKYDNHYSIFFNGTEYLSLLNIIKNKFPAYKKLKPTFYIHYEEIMQFILTNADKIYRTHDASKWAIANVSSGELMYKDDQIEIIKVFNPSNQTEFELLKSKNNFSSYDRLEPLSWNVIDNNIQTLRGDLWLDFEKDMGNVSKEGGGVKFAASKKPERLIQDIIKSCTTNKDIVLDSFLGSGTTAAVAHKMGRRYIGVEMGSHAYTHCKVRLDKVIDGEQGGISKAVNWQGGGGYRFYELAPTLINEDSFGQKVISTDYNFDMLAAAIALHEGYKYEPDNTCYWKQSHSENNSYLFVTTNHISREIIDSIKTELKDDEFLLISCKSFDTNAVTGVKNISIKKIPQSLLTNCEFGVDNYSLNIVSPPVYEEESDDE